MTPMNKLQELEAARNLEPDCDYGAVGAGRYRELNEIRRGFIVEPSLALDASGNPRSASSLATGSVDMQITTPVRTDDSLVVTYRVILDDPDDSDPHGK